MFDVNTFKIISVKKNYDALEIHWHSFFKLGIVINEVFTTRKLNGSLLCSVYALEIKKNIHFQVTEFNKIPENYEFMQSSSRPTPSPNTETWQVMKYSGDVRSIYLTNEIYHLLELLPYSLTCLALEGNIAFWRGKWIHWYKLITQISLRIEHSEICTASSRYSSIVSAMYRACNLWLALSPLWQPFWQVNSSFSVALKWNMYAIDNYFNY